MKKKKFKKLKQFFTMKKLAVMFLITLISLIVFNFREIIFRPYYPEIVIHYSQKYNEMAKTNYLKQLTMFSNGSLIIYGKLSDGTELYLSMNDSIAGLNYSQLIEWEHKHLMYWSRELQTRPEMPILILTTNIILESDGFIALGRCGEFALLYNGLLLANGYESRIVVDCSTQTDDRVAGDHVWNEVWINETWIHVDPTENRIGDNYMYADPNRWNKNVNCVYTIEFSEIEDVTETYR